jgi:hypothetical protein
MIHEPLRNTFYGNTPHTHIMCPSRESNQGPTGYYVYAMEEDLDYSADTTICSQLTNIPDYHNILF